MGLIVKLEFENGERTVEIDSNKKISFLDYDIDYDILMASMGDDETHEYKFYAKYSNEGLSALMHSYYLWDSHDHYKHPYHQDWTKTFVEAIEKQGVEVFGRGISDKEIARIIFDEYQDADNFMEFVNTFATEEEIAKWVTGWLGEAIREDNDSGTMAEILAHYLNIDDVEIELERNMYGADDHLWENTEQYFVTLKIFGEEIFKWSYITKYTISNPVTFDGFVQDDDDGYYESSDVWARERAESVVNDLGLAIPEIEKPDPPDHPTSDKNGEFAVLYIFGSEYSWDNKQDTWELVPYKTKRDAENAVELSGEIFEDQGDRDKYADKEDTFEMKILRRLTKEELAEREMARRQETLFEEQEEEDEWKEEWALLEPEETP